MTDQPTADVFPVDDQSIRHNRRIMAYCAAAMYAAAALDGAIEILLPNVPSFSLLPIYVVAAMTAFMFFAGPHLPRRVIVLNGPLGVALVSYALATTKVTASDSAVLFALPVLWQSLFFGRRGAVAILLLIAAGEALALHALGPYGYPARWVDVMVSTTAIAAVVTTLEGRNERLLATLSMEARVDPLTGLLNRRGFDERAAAELSPAVRGSRPFALVSLDIDHFKLVNDQWGHDVGDQVLRHVGGLLREQARDGDILARFGGEEFVALLPDADLDGAQMFADRVRESLVRRTGGLPAVRLSAGIRVGEPSSEVTALLAEADLALYDAKRAGRDRTTVFAAATA
jgi:diguanylate cyclase (GGDEF)-like protein